MQADWLTSWRYDAEQNIFQYAKYGTNSQKPKKKLEIVHSVATRKFWQHTTNIRYDFLPCCLILSVDFLYYFSKQIIKKTKYSDSTKTKKKYDSKNIVQHTGPFDV